MRVRLNKYLSLCGLGSRRKVEDLITSGRVRINNRTIKNLAQMIESDQDIVEFDGSIINPILNFHYLILNKPTGYVTTQNDEKGRPIVMDLIPEKYRKLSVFPVGRLDKDTEGLLLFTNDGELAHRLTHPKFNIPKEYIVELDRPLEQDAKEKIQRGIFIHQIKAKTMPASIEKIDVPGKMIKITIKEGKKRQIRYSFLKFGYKVKKLKRVTDGSLKLTGVNRGTYRLLKKKEIKELKALVGLK